MLFKGCAQLRAVVRSCALLCAGFSVTPQSRSYSVQNVQ